MYVDPTPCRGDLLNYSGDLLAVFYIYCLENNLLGSPLESRLQHLRGHSSPALILIEQCYFRNTVV